MSRCRNAPGPTVRVMLFSIQMEVAPCPFRVQAPRPVTKPRVLICEDDPEVVNWITSVLEGRLRRAARVARQCRMGRGPSPGFRLARHLAAARQRHGARAATSQAHVPFIVLYARDAPHWSSARSRRAQWAASSSRSRLPSSCRQSVPGSSARANGASGANGIGARIGTGRER